MSPPEERDFRLTYPEEPGRVIRGRTTLPRSAREGPFPFVLVLHGFKGFMNWGFFPELARRLAARGMAVVQFNTSASGIGEDLESFTDEAGFARGSYTRQLEDIERVRAHVESGAVAEIDTRRAGLLGHSRGGGIGLIHAAERGDYRAVVTWSAIDSTDRFDMATKEAWRRDGRLPVVNARTGQTLFMDAEVLEDFEAHRERLDIPAACRRLTAPTLVVHGSEDESVPVGAVSRVAGALPEGSRRTVIVPGAGHTFGATHPPGTSAEVPAELELVLGESVAWLANHLLESAGDV